MIRLQTAGLLVIAQLGCYTNLFATGGESHGGNDSPSYLLQEARQPAAKMIEAFDKASVSSDSSVAALLESLDLARWADVVLTVKHQWPTDDNEDQQRLLSRPPSLRIRCGVTQKDSDSIQFSTSVCQDVVLNLNAAVRVTLHETLHIVGITDEVLTDKLVDLVFRQKHSSENLHNTMTPEVLFEQSFEPSHQGISKSAAQTLCDRFKKIAEHRFFLVYCVFHNKHWSRFVQEQHIYKNYRFMGYQTTHINQTLSMRGLFMQQTSTHAKPIFRSENVPYRSWRELPRSVYGLRVMGLGPIGHGTAETIILDSRNIDGSGIIQVYFDSSIKALVACKAAKIASSEVGSFKYFRSACVVSQAGDQYFYQIKSKNPFL